jgi:hypothetical protein
MAALSTVAAAATIASTAVSAAGTIIGGKNAQTAANYQATHAQQAADYQARQLEERAALEREAGLTELAGAQEGGLHHPGRGQHACQPLCPPASSLRYGQDVIDDRFDPATGWRTTTSRLRYR